MKTGCFRGNEERSDEGDQLHWSSMPYFVTNVGLAEQWTALWHPDILCSGK